MATAGEFEFKILNVEVVFKLCSNAADKFPTVADELEGKQLQP